MFLIAILVQIILVQSCEIPTFVNVKIKATKYFYLVDNSNDTSPNDAFTGCINETNGFKDILKITVENESVPIVYESAVKNLEWLHELTLERDGIEEIKPGAFQNLQTISVINLSWNKLKNIPEGVFNNLNVKRLLLSRNSISDISSNAFSNMPYLAKLDVSNNLLKTWNSAWFTNTPNLVFVSATYNEIESLPAKAFSNLKEQSINIYLAHNKISSIDATAFSGIKQLEFLDLDNNSIATINKEVFSQFKQINNLMLNNNQITCWTEDFMNGLPTTQILGLNGNQLDCKCLLEMKNWAKSHTANIRLGVRSIECMKMRIEAALEAVRNITYNKL